LAERLDSPAIQPGWTATEPAPDTSSTPTDRESTLDAPSIPAWVERVGFGHLTILTAAMATVMAVAFLATPVSSHLNGLVQVVETAGAIERVALWQRTVLDLFGFDPNADFPALNKAVLAWTVRLAYLGMFAAQALAFIVALRSPAIPFWKWLIGPLLAHLGMLLMPPSNADVFFYAVTGDLALNDINPYVHRMSEYPDNPFLPYNHWVDMTAVYGPFWTAVNSGIVWLTGPDPALAALAFKIFLGAFALALAVLTWWFVLKLTGIRQFASAAGILVAWQPNLIVESTGLAHNDPVMMLLSMIGVMLAVLGGVRAIRGGVVMVTVSALVKYTSLPLLGLLGLARLSERREPRALRRIVTAWLLDGIAIAAVLVACFLPFWAGTQTIREMVTEPGRLFSSPLYLYPKVLIEHLGPNSIAHQFERITSVVIQIAAILITLAVILWFGRQTWNLAGKPSLGDFPAWTRPMLAAWAIITTTLALLPVNSHPWYWTWPVVPIAIYVCYDAASNASQSDGTFRLPRWLWIYLAATCVMTIAYHTRIVHP
jgi:hypothetical protein